MRGQAPFAHRLPRWQRRGLFLSGALLLASGLVWLGLHYGAGADGLPHPLEPWAMKLHGAAAMLALFVLGAVAGGHVPVGWRASRRHRWAAQRGSGIVLCVLALLLAVSGWLLYYLVPEGLRPGLGWAHTVLGAAMAFAVLVHRRGVHRRRA